MSAREIEVIELLKRMRNKPIPGGGFTNRLTGHLQIPDFDEIKHNCQIGIEDNFFEVDIYARTADHANDWVIEVKTADPKISDVQKLLVMSQLVHATPWLVTFGRISEPVKVIANRSKVYFTDEANLQTLRESIALWERNNG